MDANNITPLLVIASSFNPRARDGREMERLIGYSLKSVSIHAPVMDAKAMEERH